MKKIIDNDSKSSSPGRLGANHVYIHGMRYDNTAAKFWTTLVDEVLDDYPRCEELSLEASSGGILVPDFLTPEAALQRDMDRLLKSGEKESFEEIIAAMEVIGPPSPVLLTLRAEGQALLNRPMDTECLDADILPFLIVWLLEWSHLSESSWNRDEIKGDFIAEDRERRIIYKFRFTLHNRHLSEGLFRREVTVYFTRYLR